MSVDIDIEKEYGVIPQDRAEKLSAIKGLVKMYHGVQKHRVGMGNRIDGLVKEYDKPEKPEKPVKNKVVKCKSCGNKLECPECGLIDAENTVEMKPLERLMDVFSVSEEIEKSIKKHVEIEVKSLELEIYESWLKKVRGIGPILAGGFISCMKHPARFHPPNEPWVVKISSLWHYAGMHVVNGEAPVKESGKKVTWNPLLRTICWLAGESFVKTKGYYRARYQEFRADEDQKSKQGFTVSVGKSIGFVPKEDYIRKAIVNIVTCENCDYTTEEPITECPNCGEPIKTNYTINKARREKLKEIGVTQLWVGMTPGHCYERAKRKTEKLFLAHLLQKWCEIEGVPIAAPYAQTILGHTGITDAPLPDEEDKI